MRFTAVQRIINDERRLDTNVFGIRVENTVRITCVFNAFPTRIRQVQKCGLSIAILTLFGYLQI